MLPIFDTVDLLITALFGFLLGVISLYSFRQRKAAATARLFRTANEMVYSLRSEIDTLKKINSRTIVERNELKEANTAMQKDNADGVTVAMRLQKKILILQNEVNQLKAEIAGHE